MFSSPASGVGSRTVHFGRVLARESAAAVSSTTPVGVDDDFSARQTGVRIRAARVNEPAGGVDEHGCILGHQGSGKNRFDHVVQHLLTNPCLFGLLGAEFIDHVSVLNGDDHVVDVGRLAVAAVHEGHLRFCVGPRPR